MKIVTQMFLKEYFLNAKLCLIYCRFLARDMVTKKRFLILTTVPYEFTSLYVINVFQFL